MIEKRRETDDDVVELPELGPLGDPEELGVDGGEDEPAEPNTSSEDIGLDAETAEDDPFAFAEISQRDEEETRWLDGADAEAGDLVDMDALAGENEEYGHTAGNEAADDLEIDEPGGDEDERVAVGDAGEEGVDEEPVEGGDDDTTALPPIDGQVETAKSTSDQSAEDLDLGEDSRIDDEALGWDEDDGGLALPPPYPASLLDVVHLGPSDDAVLGFARAGGRSLAVGERLYELSGRELVVVDAPAIAEHALTSVAVTEAGAIVVGTRMGGAFVDRGEGFAPANQWRRDDASFDAFFVAVEPAEEGVARLWGRTRGGALFRSEDLGAKWSAPMLMSPVVSLAIDRGEVVVVMGSRSGGAQLARTRDGGRGFAMKEVIGLKGGASQGALHLAVRNGHVLVARDEEEGGPYLTRDGGTSWERVAALLGAGPAAFVHEEGRMVIYAGVFHEAEDRGFVVRYPLDGEKSVVLDVREERQKRRLEARGDLEGDNRVYAVAAERRDQATEVWIATGAGLFVVRVRSK